MGVAINAWHDAGDNATDKIPAGNQANLAPFIPARWHAWKKRVFTSGYLLRAEVLNRWTNSQADNSILPLSYQ